MKIKNFFKKLFLLIITAVFSLLFITCVSAPDYAGLGRADDVIPLTSRAITGVLPNGLKYYIMENSYPENRAYLALVVNAGSVLETEEQRGFAHFVEHLAFNDTERFPKLELIDYLRSLGMRFGSDLNAYTSYDETVYYFDVPLEILNGVKRIPDKALAILDDWTYAVSFKPEDVESEKLVVLEEARTRLGAIDRVRKIIFPILFDGSAYAQREPIGLQSVIENAAVEQVRAFYDRWYTSDNMALVFVGDFDGKALEAELQNHFHIPAAEHPVNRPVYELPPPKRGNFRVEIITDPELTSSSYDIFYKQRQGAQKGTLAGYRESIVDYLIQVMLTLRFEEVSSNPESAANDYWGGIWRWGYNSRFFNIGTDPKTGNAEQALRELLLEIETVRRFGFTESELETAKISLVSYLERVLSEKDRRDSRAYINGFASNFLTGEDMADIEWEVNAVSALLPGISLGETTEAVKNYLSTGDIVVFLIAPQGEAYLPSVNRIKEIFNETERAAIAPRQNAVVSGELMNEVPASGKILSYNIDEETGAKVLVLENGAAVIFQETANRNNEVVLYAVAKGGISNADINDAASVNLMAEMVAASGLGAFSRTELINKLAGKQVSFSFWSGTYYRGLQGSSTSKDLKTLFEMLYLFFTETQFDERAIAAMLDQYRTILLRQDDNPQNVFSREITRTIYNNHPLFMPLEYEDIDKVSLERAFNFFTQCINPADYTFIFTGNIDEDQILEYISAYIASIPETSSRMNSVADLQIPLPERSERIINKGIDERCMVYLGWFSHAPSEFNEKRNQIAAVLSEYLNITLNDEIREELGGVYSISSSASVSVIPSGEYNLLVYFQCNPARADELIAAVQNCIMTVINETLNIDVFNQSIEALLKQHEASIQGNLHIAQSYANSAGLYDTPLSRLNQRPDVIRSVTALDVQELCRQMLVSGPMKVILYPER